MFKSAFCGIIDEIPGISVDNFENPGEVKARAYFLSHCHSDHTQGLYSGDLVETLETTGACIYMSESTAAIVDHENTDSRIMKYVKRLELGTTTVTLQCDPIENLDEVHISVSLIPAGHSFGSVMFLFTTTSKTVLFTGDFRMCPNDLSKFAHFHKGTDPIHIDAMYVDTTFIGHKYLNFPRRTESIESLLGLISRHLRCENNRVALHTSARYGYECVFNEIHDKLGLKVYVGERWNIYSKLLHLVYGVTSDENTTKIHLCRNMHDKKDHSKCLTAYQNDCNFLYIHFSAMKWDNFEIDDSTYKRVSDKRIDICFPTHCSRSELLYFVNYFQPKKVIGFPEEFPKEMLAGFCEKNTQIAQNMNSFKTSKKRKSLCNDSDVIGITKISNKLDRKVIDDMFSFID